MSKKDESTTQFRGSYTPQASNAPKPVVPAPSPKNSSPQQSQPIKPQNQK